MLKRKMFDFYLYICIYFLFANEFQMSVLPSLNVRSLSLLAERVYNTYFHELYVCRGNKFAFGIHLELSFCKRKRSRGLSNNRFRQLFQIAFPNSPHEFQ